MIVKFKKLHPEAVTPSYAKEGDAGLDLTAISVDFSSSDLYVEYDTGIALEIPLGYVGLVFPRSSISKTGHTLANAVGVIDSGYRGSVKLRMRMDPTKSQYKIGEKVGQLIVMPFPLITLIESSNLSQTARGSGGFGSTN